MHGGHGRRVFNQAMTTNEVRAASGLDDTGVLVSARNVSKRFRTRGGVVEALRGIDLQIRQGEFVSLLGPSGCGKSTLLRIIGGLHHIDTGVLTIAGATADAARTAKQFGLVPQAP